MSRKKGSGKISAVKRGNRLRTKLQKQGKLKTKRNRIKPKKILKQNPSQPTEDNAVQSDSDNDENFLDMFENEDMSFLQHAIANKSYSMFNDFNEKGEKIKKKGEKRKHDSNLEEFESQYEQSIQETSNSKKRKYLLPIKTSTGIVMRSQEACSSDEDEDEILEKKTSKQGTEDSRTAVLNSEFGNKEEIRSADLLAFRQNTLSKKKIKLGILCSGLTESPEEKIHNFKALLQMLNETDPEVCVTIKKLTLVSILEVFKDLLPEYEIKHHNNANVKLKKTVKQLQTFESSLLKYYKGYLKEIEKMVSILKRKRGDNKVIKDVEISMAKTALSCLCDLLLTHPYFNFSKNVIHLLVPFLNNGKEFVREMVSTTIKKMFKTDKKGDLSLEIVRNINKLVKSRKNVVHSDVILVLLSLNLKDVNLDKEKEDEIKRKKDEAKKHKLLKLSKREKKRIKKLKALEKDLLETKAEENRKSKDHCLTEVTKTIFAIFFRILKEPNSRKLLNAALEGIAKFAHCINLEFYQDLIIVLDNLVQNENIGYKEKLCCVWTVFTVLHYQGTSIYIDPVRFYSHFYSNILQINAGQNHVDLPVIMKTVDFLLLKRRKHLSLQRLLAFVKRLTTLSLQILPHGSLALLSLIWDILQVNNSTDILLDFEEVRGIYYPEIEEPEYCNACATSLWEILPLQKHFHPTVRDFAARLAKIGQSHDDSQEKKLSNKSAEQLFEQYNGENVKFIPAIPAPRKFAKTKRIVHHLANSDLENYVKHILADEKLNFQNLL
ncbi:hypothetical protein RUM43_007357 [Polyplax serrata]|uniref:NOC3-like protein n=1 Tax=Polyplax serrata TaxID=468196 RepID=A0AAN8PMG3_POLSC